MAAVASVDALSERISSKSGKLWPRMESSARGSSSPPLWTGSPMDTRGTFFRFSVMSPTSLYRRFFIRQPRSYRETAGRPRGHPEDAHTPNRSEDRRVGKSVHVRVGLGGRRLIKKKQICEHT